MVKPAQSPDNKVAPGRKDGPPKISAAQKEVLDKAVNKKVDSAAPVSAWVKASKRPKVKFAGETVLMMQRLLHDDGLLGVQVKDEAFEKHRRQSLMRIVRYQNGVIIGLIAVLLLGVPFFEPVYDYYALSSTRKVSRLVSLDAPNLTNQTILSWATSGITEIMTFGFGDIEDQLASQRHRFTDKGWKSFVDAVYRNNLVEIFKERQLVLTSVPADVPVITSQGVDPDNKKGYQWTVELPIIMTYTTNNNVAKREKNIIKLTIVRVPTDEKSVGIAIKSWK
ncbi:MAG: DotI/IcmL family type IV secretion protein [Alphaproteobacteria bacterium]|nr:DotI/IcmL family type IV secretion protein [Alphaproteobacteria bacterium]